MKCSVTGQDCCELLHPSAHQWRPLDSRTRTRFDLKFFRVFSKYRPPGKLHFTIFTLKVSTVIFNEGGYALSRSQMILITCFRDFDILVRLVVEWQRLPLFPAKMTPVHARALLSILGLHVTSPKIKLRNYRFFWVSTFTRYYST